MPKLIKNWEELAKEVSTDGKHKIQLEETGYCAWIVPVRETPETEGVDYFKHHAYLSTHTFYGSTCEESTKKLQKFGFDVIIDNWDKKRKEK